ncbi:M56 family metallopeptidase [Paenibacillus sp. FSL E2-0190]|jgi:beta-lactamase regulating signal transducer with metallopeptidase domain|uniref:M56 family metallopeptidase n=2 Tax=Paenibacillus TaxID=44249 RepID=UPI0030ED5C55
MITIWSIQTTLLVSSLFICLYCLITKKSSTISKVGVPVLSLLLLLITIRLLVPIEVPFAHTIELPKFLPIINDFFNFSIYSFSDQIKINLYLFLGVIWLSGTLISISRIFQRYSNLCKLIMTCSIKKNINSELLSVLQKEIKIPKNLKLIETSLTSVPMMYGFFRPTIVFPVHNFTDQEEYFIIRHELHHYFNKDNWIKTIIELLCAFYWWNPFVYQLRNQVDRILEIKNDLTITKNWEEYKRLNYLEFLVNTYKNSIKSKYMPFTMDLIDKNRSTFMNRFELLLSNNKPKESWLRFSTTSILALSCFVSTLFFVVQPRYSFPDNYASTAIDITPDTAYIIKNKDGTFDIYLNKLGYFTTIQEINPFYDKLPIIKMKEDDIK